MDPASLLIFVTLIALSAFFSGTEIALMTISKHTIEWFLREKRVGAKALKRIKEKNDQLLITILIGNNLVNVGASALATVSAIKLAESLNLPWEYGIAFATGAVTLTLLLFWEITPKSLASKYTGTLSLLVAPFYEVLMKFIFPVVYIIELFIRGIKKMFRTPEGVTSITPEELKAFLDISHEQWAVESHEHRKIKNILDLSDTDASSAMTPRVSVDLVSRELSVDDLCAFFLSSSHSRIPVYGETPDDIDYVVSLREAFIWKQEGMGSKKLKDLDLEKIIKVPATQPIDRIFTIFQKSHKHIALVLDEHGWVDGVITLEDIIEEVFGDIKDEKDREEEYIRKTSNGAIVVKGSVLVEDVLEEFNLSSTWVNIDEDYVGETMSYLILSILERFPKNGELITLTWSKIQLLLTVEEIEDGKIETVRVEKIKLMIAHQKLH